MEDMTDEKLAGTIQSLIVDNCIDVDEEDLCYDRAEEATSIENSPYGATTLEKGCYVTFPNGQKFLIYVKEV